MYKAIYCDKKRGDVYIWDDEVGLIANKYENYAYAKDGSGFGGYTTIHGDRVAKITKFGYNQEGLFESDVPWETRTLIDLYGDSDEVSKNHCVAYIDIETSIEGGYPDVKTANQPITAITLYTNKSKIYKCFILDIDSVVAPVSIPDTELIVCATEESLLEAFLNEWIVQAPTVVTGWNIDGFDMPYILRRIDVVLGNKFVSMLSSIGVVYIDEKTERVVVAGVNILDYLVLYKKYEMKPLPNYRLDTVAKEELKIGKVEYDGNLGFLMKTDINKFIEYNVHDVKLVVKLDDVKQFIQLAMSICHVCHTGYEKFAVSSAILEGAILTYLRRNNLVAPNKPPKLDEDDEFDEFNDDEDNPLLDSNSESGLDKDVGFKGAYVKDPVPGRYSWVASADINSLYPSTIMTLNISPETKIAVIKDWDTEKFARKEITEIVVDDEKFTYDEFVSFIDKNQIAVAANGAMYDQRKKGCIPEILKKWFAERVEYKDKMKECANANDKDGEIFWKRRQQVQKILLNSMYGVLGLKSFRFYDLDNALAVTSTGQEIIKTSARLVNKRINRECNTIDKDYVVYIDTDSLYIAHYDLLTKNNISTNDDEKCTQFCIDNITSISNELNQFYVVAMRRMFGCQTNRIRILPDVIASTAIWIRKKRYAMRKVYNMETHKAKVAYEYKGLDIVRSSFPKKFRAFLSDVVNSMLDNKSKEVIDKLIIDFKDNLDKLELEDISKNTSVRFKSSETASKKIDFNPKDRTSFSFVNGSTAQVKASLAYNDMLKHYSILSTEPIMSGEKIKWAYLDKNPFNLVGLAFKDDGRDPNEIMEYIKTYISRQKIWDKEFKKKLDSFYLAIGWGEFNENVEAISAFFSFDD